MKLEPHHPRLTHHAFDPWESDAWAPPPTEHIDEWAERVIVLPPEVARKTGPLDLDMTPYARRLLRAATDPRVEKIVMQFSAQSTKTTILMIIILYYLFKNPYNCLHVMPDEDQADQINVERYQPIIRASPELLAAIPHPGRDMQSGFIRVRDAQLTFESARSPSGLASRAKAIVAMDEIDKYQLWTGREANPINLAVNRQRTFDNRKLILASTPTTEFSLINRELQGTSNEKYFVPCPYCNHYQDFVFGGPEAKTPGIKWPKEIRDPKKIKAEKLAWYECEACHGKILDRYKATMNRNGMWVPKGARVENGRVVGAQAWYPEVGAHLWTAYSPWVSFSDIAAEYLKTRNSPDQYMDFINSWRAEVYRTVVNELRAPELREKSYLSEYNQGEVPEGAWTLTAGVDVQRPAGVIVLYYVIRAWGAEEESWLVKCGSCVGWEALYTILFQSSYRLKDGTPVSFGIPPIVDSGDGVNTLEVYDWCLQTGCIPSKGNIRSGEQLQWGKVERLSQELALLNVNVNTFKTKVHRLIRSSKWHLPKDLDEAYYTHMTSEQLVQEVDKRTGQPTYSWKVNPPSTANHWFDSEVLNQAGSDLLCMQNRTEFKSSSPPGGDSPQEEEEGKSPQESFYRSVVEKNVRLFSS